MEEDAQGQQTDAHTHPCIMRPPRQSPSQHETPRWASPQHETPAPIPPLHQSPCRSPSTARDSCARASWQHETPHCPPGPAASDPRTRPPRSIRPHTDPPHSIRPPPQVPVPPRRSPSQHESPAPGLLAACASPCHLRPLCCFLLSPRDLEEFPG